MTRSKHIFCFGLGYSARILAKKLHDMGWKVSGTCTTEEKKQQLAELGYDVYIFNNHQCDIPKTIFPKITHILHSIPPVAEEGMVYRYIQSISTSLLSLEWVGYLSTTGVYGNHDGEVVTETSELRPPNERTVKRVATEKIWLESGLPVHIFRLSGIYGAERNYFKSLREQEVTRIYKKGQLFSRIHVEDIANILMKSIENPNPQSIYNCADDKPESQDKVVDFAAKLMGIESPPLIPYENANLTVMQRSFYQNNRIITNNKIKNELDVHLKYPTYEDGLKAVYAGQTD
ncbi:MAG: SDR family oxidoreductase [Rickettsiales bacterium]|nr:SDR family oxidoreductase [Rickettsiales bacterium]